MKNLAISKAVEIYYRHIEIGTADICDIFNCGRNKALRLKIVRDEMVKLDKVPFNANHVNTEIAFKVWSLDIKDLERRLRKIQKLEGETCQSQTSSTK